LFILHKEERNYVFFALRLRSCHVTGPPGPTGSKHLPQGRYHNNPQTHPNETGRKNVGTYTAHKKAPEQLTQEEEMFFPNPPMEDEY